MKKSISWLGVIVALLGVSLFPLGAQAQLFFTNSSTAGAGNWSLANWTNQSGSGMTPGTTVGAWAGSNLVFNTLGGESTNNVAAGASFGWVTWQQSATNRVATAASRYYFTGFTNSGNNTVLFGPLITFSNSSIAPVIYNEGTLTMSANITNLTSSTMTVDSVGTTTLSGIIAGSSGGVTKNGSGLLTLSGTNTFTGGVILNNGTLKISNNAGLGTGTFTINGGKIDTGATRTTSNNNAQKWNGDFEFLGGATLNLGTGSVDLGTGVRTVTVSGANALTVGGAITNSGSFVKAGTNTLILTGANTYGGGTTISAGTLQFNSAGAIAGSGANVTNNYGAVALAGYAIDQTFLGRMAGTSSGTVALATSSANNLDFSAGGANLAQVSLGAVGTVTNSGTIAPYGSTYRLGGGGGILVITNGGTLSGANSLVVNGSRSGGQVALVGSNSFSAGTTINGDGTANGGIVRVGSTYSLGTGAVTINDRGGLTANNIDPNGAAQGNVTLSNAINIAGATAYFGISGNSTYHTNLTLAGTVNLGGTARELSVRSSTLTISGSITNGGLTFNGNNSTGNSLVLTGTNTYAGGTMLNNSGTVKTGGSSPFGTGTVTFNGTQWNPSGDCVISNNVVFNVNTAGNALQSTAEFLGSFSGTGNFNVNGFATGIVKLSGDNSGWSGNWKFAGANKLQLNNVNALGTGTTLTFSDGASMGVLESLIDLSGGSGVTQNVVLGTTGAGGGTAFPEIKTTGNMQLSGVISGPAGIGFQKTGTGRLILTRSNTYSGVTTISAGYIDMVNGNALGDTSAGTVIASGGHLYLSNNITTYEPISIAGGSAGDGVIQNASGTNTLAGNLTWTANATVVSKAGLMVMDVASGDAITGGSFNMDIRGNGNIVINDPISGSGVYLAHGDSGTLSLLASNTFGNQIRVDQGTVIADTIADTGVASSLGTGNINNLIRLGWQNNAGGTLRYIGGATSTDRPIRIGYNTNNATYTAGGKIENYGTGALNFTAAAFNSPEVNVTAARTLTLGGTNTNDNTILGVIADNDTANGGIVRLVKADSGKWILAGASTFTGGTTVNGGMLALTSSGLLSSMVTVNSGAVLSNAGKVFGLIVNSGGLVIGGGQAGIVTNAAGGTLTPGVGGDTNYFADLTLMGNSTNLFWLGSAANHDMSTVTNSLSYGGVNGTDAPLLKLDLSSWANGANVGQTVVLYDNWAPVTAWDGTNKLFRLSDVGGLFDGMLLTNGMVFAISGSGTGQFKINYDLEGAGGPGNDIMLTVIPEPASINLLAMLGAAYFMRRRIHRKRGRWNV